MKKRHKILLFIIIAILTTGNAFSQDPLNGIVVVKDDVLNLQQKSSTVTLHDSVGVKTRSYEQLPLRPTEFTDDVNLISRIKTPEVSNIIRNDKNKINNYTGQADISIPLYNLKIHNLELPIALKYTSGGNKPTDYPTTVGLNWTLYAGGFISRSVKGTPDEVISGSLSIANETKIIKNTFEWYLEQINSPKWRSLNFTICTTDYLNSLLLREAPELDEFYVNVGDINASFYLYKGADGKFVTKIVSKEGQNFKIDVEESTPEYIYKLQSIDDYLGNKYPDSINTKIKIRNWLKLTLTNSDGMIYVFGGTLESVDLGLVYEMARPCINITQQGYSQMYGPDDVPRKGPKVDSYDFKMSLGYVSRIIATPLTFYLTEIITPEKETAKFNYKRENIVIRPATDNFAREISTYVHCESMYAKSHYVCNSVPTSEYTHLDKYDFMYPCYLKSIEIVNKDTINFSYEKTNDLWRGGYDKSVKGDNFMSEVFKNLYDNVGGQRHTLDKLNYGIKLTNIRINNNTEIDFNYIDYPTERLKLNDVIFKNSYDDNQYKYSMVYNSLKLPNFTSTATDNWGFYNGKVIPPQIKSIIQQKKYFGEKSEIIKHFKEPSLQHTKAEILEKIIYPTRGYITYDYELNDYSKQIKRDPLNIASEKGIAGGLRIKQVEMNPLGNNLIKKTYKYLSNNQSSGYSTMDIRYFYLKSGKGNNKIDTLLSYNNVIINQGIAPVVYSKVEEYLSDQGKIVYEYSSYDKFKDELPVISADYFYLKQDPSLKTMNSSFTSGELDRGLLTRKEYYNKANQLLKTEDYAYNHSKSEFIETMSVYHPWIYNMNISKIYTHYPSLKTKRTVEYRNNIAITTTENFTYDLLYKQLTKNELLNSSGNKYRTEYKYPFNFYQINQDLESTDSYVKPKHVDVIKPSTLQKSLIEKNYNIYKLMNERFIISPIIEKIIYNNENEIARLKKEYSCIPYNIDDPIIFLEKIKTSSTGADGFEEIVKYDLVDQVGNVLQKTLIDNTIISYLWSYKRQYPVAEIKNASYAQVSSALGVDPATISDLSEPDMTQLNGLRTKLPQAMVSTYSYKPLVGMLTATDAKGFITHYEYDGFGRLKNTYTDNSKADKDLVQTIEYNYWNSGNTSTDSIPGPGPGPIDPIVLVADTFQRGQEGSIYVSIPTNGNGIDLQGWDYDSNKIQDGQAIVKTYATIDIDEYSWTRENVRIKYKYNDWMNLTQADVNKYSETYLGGKKITLDQFENIFGSWVSLYPKALSYYDRFSVYSSKGGSQETGWKLPSSEDIWQLYGLAPRKSGNIYQDIQDFLFMSPCENMLDLRKNMMNRENTSGLTLTPLGMRESYYGDNAKIYGFGTLVGLRTSGWTRIEAISDIATSGIAPGTRSIDLYHFSQARYTRAKTDQELGYKLYIDQANDQITMLGHDKTSSLAELPKGLERGIALRYANRKEMKILKKWSEIQAEATQIRNALNSVDVPQPLPVCDRPVVEEKPDPYQKGAESSIHIRISEHGAEGYGVGFQAYDFDKNEERGTNQGFQGTYKTIGVGEYDYTKDNLKGIGRYRWGLNYSWFRWDDTNLNSITNSFSQETPLSVNDFTKVYGTWFSLLPYISSYTMPNLTVIRDKEDGTVLSGWGLPTLNDILQVIGQAPSTGDVNYDILNFVGASSKDVPANHKANWYNQYNNISGLTITPLGSREPIEGNLAANVYAFKVLSKLRLKDNGNEATFTFYMSGSMYSSKDYHYCQVRYTRAKTDQELGYKMYVDLTNDQVVMLPYTEASTLKELPKGLERGIALRYTNRNLMKVLKSWTDIQAEAARIKTALKIN